MMENVLTDIEAKRLELIESVAEKGLNDWKTVQLSKELDRLLNLLNPNYRGRSLLQKAE